jgi:hypothetical protein
MYLELARVFASATVGITQQKPDLQGSTDLPIATQVHIQFVMSAVTIIFGVSYLEAHVNRWLDELLNDRIDFTGKNLQPHIEQKLLAGISELKTKYPGEQERNRLFGQEKLTDKIKLLYKTLDVSMPFSSSHPAERKLWENLINLQNLRNDLIHLKPGFLESPQFMDYLKMDRAKREELARVPTLIIALMSNHLPVVDFNLTENVILSEAMLLYADKPFFENMMLGHAYNEQERLKYLRRRPPVPTKK